MGRGAGRHVVALRSPKSRQRGAASAESREAESGAGGVGEVELFQAMDMNEEACKSLPFTFVLFLVFMITQYSHRHNNYALQKTMSDIISGTIAATTVPCSEESGRRMGDISRNLLAGGGGRGATSAVSGRGQIAALGKELSTVMSLQEVNIWLEATLVRWLWADGPNGRAVKMNFNHVLGGARVRQRRLASAECPGNQVLLNLTENRTCFSGRGADSTAPIGNLGDLGIAAFNTQTDENFYTYWFDIDVDECTVSQHIVTMSDEKWLRPGVDLVIAEICLYNVQIAAYVAMEIMFLISADGSVTPKHSVSVLPASVYSSVVPLIGDIFFAFLLICMAIGEAINTIMDILAGDFVKELRWYKALNVAIIVFGIGFCIFFGSLSASLQTLAEDVAALPSSQAALEAEGPYPAGVVARTWDARHSQFDACYDKIFEMADLLRWWELQTFFYSLILMAKFFHVFDTQPKLGDIMKTMRRACYDVAWFMVVFCLVFYNFTLGAYFLFGQQLKDWSNMSLATNSAFRTLMGDFDFNSMYSVAPISAMLWFWIYMVGFYLLMLNMLLTIVLDTYAEVKKESANSTLTILSVGGALLRRIKTGRGGQGGSGGGLDEGAQNVDEFAAFDLVRDFSGGGDKSPLRSQLPGAVKEKAQEMARQHSVFEEAADVPDKANEVFSFPEQRQERDIQMLRMLEEIHGFSQYLQKRRFRGGQAELMNTKELQLLMHGSENKLPREIS